ncbi:hypothetical protein EIN_436880, partial [Entamoeba invadens IP1]
MKRFTVSLVFLCFVFVSLCVQAEETRECVPKTINEDEGFVSLVGSLCTSNSVYCFNSTFRFNGNSSFYSIITSGTLTFDCKFNLYTYTSNLILSENSITTVSLPIHIQNSFTLHSNSLAKIEGYFSIAGKLLILNPKLDIPPLVLWNSPYLHLNRNMSERSDFSIVNPIDNTKYTAKNNIVKCVLTNSLYGDNYKTISTYGFDYPHCPCNDNVTDCQLYLANNISAYNFDSKQLAYTTLHIEKDTRITNAQNIKTMIMSDDVSLDLNGVFISSNITFSIGEVVVKDIQNTQSTFMYNSTNNELICTNSISSDILVNDKVNYIKINCSSTIESMQINNDKFVYITKEVKEIQSLNFNNYGMSSTIIIYLESENTIMQTQPFQNCVLMTITSSEMNCLKCNSKTQLLNNKCVNLEKNCLIYDANNHCSFCKYGYLLNKNNECVQSTNGCLVGTTENCYKCETNKQMINRICVTNTICKLTDGNSCLKCSAGDYTTRCESCEANCELCENGKCTLCKQNYLLQDSNKCEYEGISFTNGKHIIS